MAETRVFWRDDHMCISPITSEFRLNPPAKWSWDYTSRVFTFDSDRLISNKRVLKYEKVETDKYFIITDDFKVYKISLHPWKCKLIDEVPHVLQKNLNNIRHIYSSIFVGGHIYSSMFLTYNNQLHFSDDFTYDGYVYIYMPKDTINIIELGSKTSHYLLVQTSNGFYTYRPVEIPEDKTDELSCVVTHLSATDEANALIEASL